MKIHNKTVSKLNYNPNNNNSYSKANKFSKHFNLCQKKMKKMKN